MSGNSNDPHPMSGRARRILTATAIVLTVLGRESSAAAASADSIERGHALLEANCGRCHAIGMTGDSPFSAAPPFRTLHERYPIEDLEEALAEGIISGHPAMPEFTFAPHEIDDIISYLKSISR